MTDLASVLERLELSQYLEAFKNEGFDTWETVLDITEVDLCGDPPSMWAQADEPKATLWASSEDIEGYTSPPRLSLCNRNDLISR